MGLMPASYKVTARSVSRVLGDGRRQSDRSLKGHEAGVRKGQPWAVNHHPGIVAVYGPPACPSCPTTLGGVGTNPTSATKLAGLGERFLWSRPLLRKAKQGMWWSTAGQ